MFFIYTNTPSMSSGTHSYEMARRLVSMSHEVHMITSRRENSEEQSWFEAEEEEIHVHWLPVDYSNEITVVFGMCVSYFNYL